MWNGGRVPAPRLPLSSPSRRDLAQSPSMFDQCVWSRTAVVEPQPVDVDRADPSRRSTDHLPTAAKRRRPASRFLGAARVGRSRYCAARGSPRRPLVHFAPGEIRAQASGSAGLFDTDSPLHWLVVPGRAIHAYPQAHRSTHRAVASAAELTSLPGVSTRRSPWRSTRPSSSTRSLAEAHRPVRRHGCGSTAAAPRSGVLRRRAPRRRPLPSGRPPPAPRYRSGVRTFHHRRPAVWEWAAQPKPR